MEGERSARPCQHSLDDRGSTSSSKGLVLHAANASRGAGMGDFLIKHPRPFMGSGSRDRLDGIGFWREQDSLISLVLFPHPRELVDPTWSAQERAQVADYLG